MEVDRNASGESTDAAPILAAMASVKDDYAKLCDLVKETASLEGISGLLGWDEQVMMPAQASASRGAQKAALAGVIHEKATNPELGKLLERLQQGATHLDQWEQAVVRDVAIRYKRKTAIPKDLAQRIARCVARPLHSRSLL